MKTYEILKDFKGSQNGSVTEDFKKGDKVGLSDYLVASVDKTWIKAVGGADKPAPAAKTPEQLKAAAQKKVDGLVKSLANANPQNKAKVQTQLDAAKADLAKLG